MSDKKEDTPKEAAKAEPSKDEAGKKGGKKKKEEEPLSDEDQALLEEMELLAQQAGDLEPGVRRAALEKMTEHVRTSTSSMTSVPKPLKFLRPHYNALKETHASAAAGETKLMLADVLSLLAMTMAGEGTRESLNFKLLGTPTDLGSWGHEYVRHVAGEIGDEYNARLAAAEAPLGDEEMREATPPAEDLLPIILQHMIPFFFLHNAEAEAIDLLMEVGKVDAVVPHVDKTNCNRICMYLLQVANYVPEPEDSQVLAVAVSALRKLQRYPEAMRVAMRLQDDELIGEILAACEDPMVKKQMAYMLARQGVRPEADDEDLNRIMDGAFLTEHYLELARDLDVLEPKAPEDIYKTHLEKRSSSSSNIDSARANLASTFVNAFVNLGFGNDKLMLTEGNKWLYKNKEHGMMSAAASLGAILCWDVDGGLPQIDKFLYSNDNNIKAGALLGVGILNCGVRNECDPAIALLSEHIEDAKAPAHIRMGAIFGLGLAYAGTKKEEVLELLMPVVADIETPLDICAVAALSLGLAFTASCNEDIAQALMSALIERPAEELAKEGMSRLICVGVGLLYLSKQQEVEVTLELAKAVEGDVGMYCQLTLESCAYAGSGNVLKVQRLLGIAGEHADKEEEEEEAAPAPAAAGSAAGGAAGPAAAAAAAAAGGKKEDKKEKEWPKMCAQSVATLGVAFIAAGEELGTEMAVRALFHLMQYGDVPVRRAMPLGLALLATSAPMKQNILDGIGKFTHDADQEVAISSIIALGLIAGGTNNSRVAVTLRSLATFYAKEAGVLFAVRLAQGLVHAGKGLVTLSPYHPDRSLPNPTALAALVAISHICLDFKSIVLGKHHFLLYVLVAAARPRMLVTLDEDLKPLPVPVRVGLAVDTVAMAGRPKTITGFQTHTTPVLLASGERAELGTDEYLPLTEFVEGIVILKKNPDYVPPEK